MHTVWKGNISFGLINIGVKMHAAIEDKDIKFNNVDKVNLKPVRHIKVASDDQRILNKDDIVRVYEHSNQQQIIIKDIEIEKLKEKFENKSVEVLDFIKLEQIDPIYFNNSYYLSPDIGQNRAYSLLRKVLSDTNKVGLAKITIRSNEQLAVIRTIKNVIMLETIHYPDEVRPIESVPNIQDSEVNEKEYNIARLLIDQLTTEFNPFKYQNTFRKELMALIESKISKEEAIRKFDNTMSTTTNLMDMLQASLKNNQTEDVLIIDKDLNLSEPPKKKKSAKKSDKNKASV
ncbi:Ku protein [Paenibacillus sp. GCM10027627]|uniref:non-homologous end joining protein Ku n=1 Tax=unclassified Paenibacillus TaxID=185978 RepID=UPI003627D3B5